MNGEKETRNMDKKILISKQIANEGILIKRSRQQIWIKIYG